MKSPVLYIIESLICSGLFLIVYQLMIDRATSYLIRRRFLILSVAVSCMIPLLQIPIATNNLPKSIQTTYGAINTQAEYTGSNALLYIGCTIYLLGVLAMATSAFSQLYRLKKLHRYGKETKEGGQSTVISKAVKSPFSFWHTIYLPPIANDAERSHILAHECAHILHGHSKERILMEVAKTVFWFNPFIWIATRWLTEVQEMEADREALSNGFKLNDYQATLLKYLFGVNLDVVNCMSRHSLSYRFKAMTKVQAHQNWRIWILLPMVMLSFALFAVTPSRSVSGPLILIDGQQADRFDHIPPEQIKAVTVLKDSKNINKYKQQYGQQAGNGIILIELIK